MASSPAHATPPVQIGRDSEGNGRGETGKEEGMRRKQGRVNKWGELLVGAEATSRDQTRTEKGHDTHDDEVA